MIYLGIILAGGFGALLRFLLARASLNSAWTALPYSTLFVNLLGSFLIGYLSWVFVHKWQLSKDIQSVVLTGFLGGFTTFSAFSLETISLFEQGMIVRALSYVLLSVSLCLIMCLLGLSLARHS